MSIDDIKLAPFLVKKLYKNSLIEGAVSSKSVGSTLTAKDEKKAFVTEPNIIEKEILGTIKYLGKNEKKLLLIVDEKEHAFLGDDELSFLINILNACNITFQDVALINSNNNAEAIYENINAQFNPIKIIFFGTEPHLLDFPVQIPQYKIQAYNNQQYLCAPSLKKLASDKEEKKKLWMVLKVMFGI